MIITVIAVSKIKETYIDKGIKDYLKRLKPFCPVKIQEVEPEKVKASIPIEKVKDLEAEKILSHVKDDSFVIALDERGKNLTSEELASFFQQKIMSSGKSQVCLIIGGANGLSKKVLEKADFVWALSRLTFPHQLVRLLLVEQVYRAFKINNNQAYHK